MFCHSNPDTSHGLYSNSEGGLHTPRRIAAQSPVGGCSDYNLSPNPSLRLALALFLTLALTLTMTLSLTLTET